MSATPAADVNPNVRIVQTLRAPGVRCCPQFAARARLALSMKPHDTQMIDNQIIEIDVGMTPTEV
jgi:hypothetical protein